MSTPFTIDRSRYPLIIVTGKRVQADMAAALGVNEAYGRIMDEKRPFGILLDIRELQGVPDAKVRKTVAEFAKSREDDFARYCVADATVVGSRVIYGVVTAVNWLAPAKHPEKTFMNYDDALGWCERRLRESVG